jgi:membrane protease subunit (stomatin/prohibitin family)
MGIFDSLKTEAQRNFIARADDAKDDIIYKYPERNIRTMTQLTVQADEVALFYKEGVIAGTLGPGRHNLDTNNVPFISALLEKATGGNLFVAEVYFVSLREFTEVKFGGPIGTLPDPMTGLTIGLMVYGNFSFKVTEPEKLLVGMIGLKKTTNDEVTSWFKSLLLKVTKPAVNSVVTAQKSLLAATSGGNIGDIETAVMASVAKEVANYGITVIRFGDLTVSMKPEDEETLKKLSKDVAYTRLAGGFQQYAQGQSMLDAGTGMAKGGEGSGNALGGMGMGMGFGMAQMFMNQQHPQGAPPQATPPPPAAPQRTVLDRLKELNELKTAGLLTDDEYGAKKAELMKQL